MYYLVVSQLAVRCFTQLVVEWRCRKVVPLAPHSAKLHEVIGLSGLGYAAIPTSNRRPDFVFLPLRDNVQQKAASA